MADEKDQKPTEQKPEEVKPDWQVNNPLLPDETVPGFYPTLL